MLQYGKYKIMLIRKTSKVEAESQELTLVTYNVLKHNFMTFLSIFMTNTLTTRRLINAKHALQKNSDISSRCKNPLSL